MARTPSYDLLAKDAIGQALDISAVKTVEDRGQRINDYNMAVSEIYNILGYIDTEAYIITKDGVDGLMNGFNKCGYIDTSIADMKNLDKIIEIEAYAAIVQPGDYISYETFKISESDFIKHKRHKVAIDPYDETIIYAVRNNRVDYLIGESLDILFNSIRFNILYRRQPTILVINNWITEKIDLPDKYWALLVNRIASLIEYRSGIVDKALTMVKMTYEQLLVNVDSTVKSTFLKSLDTPPGVRNDI